jgi:hypothetical protein
MASTFANLELQKCARHARAASMGPAPRILSPPHPPAPGKNLPLSDNRTRLTFATVISTID